jgi:hypothetical protein
MVTTDFHQLRLIFQKKYFLFILFSTDIIFICLLIITRVITYPDRSHTIHHIILTGQSLSNGITEYPMPFPSCDSKINPSFSPQAPLSTTQPFGNVMLNDYSGNDPYATDISLQYSFTPLVEKQYPPDCGTESPASGMANEISFLNPEYQTLVTKNAVNAASFALIQKGTNPYIRGLNQIRTAQRIAKQMNKPYEVSAVVMIHGETDNAAGLSANAYKQNLKNILRDYNTDIRSITGQKKSIPLITDQTSWAGDHIRLALGQLQAEKENPGKIILVGPKYQFDYVCDRDDMMNIGVHLTNYSYRRLGEYFGKVYKKVVIDRVSWIPLSPQSIHIHDSIISVIFHVPTLPIKIDTIQVDFKKNYGFEFYQEGNTTTVIKTVKIVGDDQIQISLNETPSGKNMRLRYAYSTDYGIPPNSDSFQNTCAGAHQIGSARGNIRDSDSTKSLSGNQLENWLVHFDEPIL